MKKETAIKYFSDEVDSVIRPASEFQEEEEEGTKEVVNRETCFASEMSSRGEPTTNPSSFCSSSSSKGFVGASSMVIDGTSGIKE
jgi:hypothetical protein